MNLFKQRQPKRFSYTPRHLKEQDKDNSTEFDPKWRRKIPPKKNARTLPIFLILLGMVIVIWYVLSNYEI